MEGNTLHLQSPIKNNFAVVDECFNYIESSFDYFKLLPPPASLPTSCDSGLCRAAPPPAWLCLLGSLPFSVPVAQPCSGGHDSPICPQVQPQFGSVISSQPVSQSTPLSVRSDLAPTIARLAVWPAASEPWLRATFSLGVSPTRDVTSRQYAP